MAANPAAAAAAIVKLLNLSKAKNLENVSLINSVKKRAKVVSGVTVIPTGFENKSTDELLKELNSAYGGLAPISFTNQESLAGANLTTNKEEEDFVKILQSPSSIEKIEITACPTDSPVILPNYTPEEIEKVIKDVANECETRNVVSPLIRGFGIDEAIKAKCNIIAPTPIQAPSFLDLTSVPAPPNQAEPENVLRKPTKTLVILNTTKGLGNKVQKPKRGVPVFALKKQGESVKCGDPIINVGNKTVTSPSSGVLRNLYVKDIASKNDKLFLIEEISQQDTVDKVQQVSNELNEKIAKLSNLKEQLGKLEPYVWVLKQIWGIYEGQYQGYISYYNKFNPLVKSIEDLQTEFNINLDKLKNIATIQQDNILILTPLNAEYKKIYERLKAIPDKIAKLNTELSIIQKEQPLYFSIRNNTSALAAVNKGVNSVTINGQSYAADKQYVFIPNKIGDKKDATPIEDINEGLANVIRSFTNNILFDNRIISNWKNKDLDINSSNPFTFSELFLEDPTNYIFKFRVGLNQINGEGSMLEVRKNFFIKAKGFGEELKNISDTDVIEQRSIALREQEKNLPDDVEAEANKSFDQIVEYSKNYGYYQLNVGSAFIKSTPSPNNAIEKKRDDAKNNFDEIFANYNKIRKEITNIEKEVESFPQKLDEIITGSCKLPNSSEPSAVKINGEDVNLIAWPLRDDQNSAQASNLPKDDDNYKGNPQPNSPPVTDITYWKKYCQLATTINLLPLFWPIGLLIPTPGPLIKIPLPIIWKPIAVIPSPICLIVVGIDICGICPAPWIYVVNPGWPFPVGLVAPKESWFLSGIRGPVKIDDETASKPIAAIPTITTPLKYTQNGQEKQQPLTIDIAPSVTKTLPFGQDDLPAFERLTLTNLPYISYLVKWCSAGKKTMGFFENP